ncbi:MAG: AraC family transcriptional regulator [Mucilaginibacter sp.]
MTFYSSQVQFLHNNLYPKGYLLTQVIRSKKFTDDNYSNSISLDDIAGEAFISKFHFIRLYKTYYGITPHQHLKRVRVAAAKELLQSGMPVANVCYEIGFESVPSFTRLFKTLTGTTPFAWQTSRQKAIMDNTCYK